MAFNHVDYNKDYHKDHYKQFKVNLKTKEYEELETILSKNNMSKADFLRFCIKNFKNVSEM